MPREEASSLAQHMTVLGIMLCPHLYSTDLNGSRLLGTCDPAGEFSTAIWPLSRRLLQLLKRGLTRVGTRLTAAPPHHPREVHHGHTSTMLQMRVREADIARAAHATDTDAIREGPLDPTASCLLGLKLRRRLALPIREQRFVRLAGPDGQGAPDSPGASGSRRASAAIATGELDFDDVVITVIDRRYSGPKN
jgi:hypothetical protein